MKLHLKKVLSLIMSVSILSSLAMPVFADENPTVTKDESVFILLNSDGSIQSQTVSDWLHCDNGLAGVVDKTSLSNVTNLKSDAVPEQVEDTITWNTNDTDVYYQGTTDQTPPLTTAIDYELNGEKINAEQLIGKSGHVKITITLENHEKHQREIAGQERTIYTPFVTLVAADMPRESFSNVKIPHGTVQTDSQNQLACAVALPGMKQTFDGLLTGKMSELNDYFLDQIIIEADTDHFVMPSILLAAATSMDELKKQLDFSNVDGTLQDVQNGTAQLDEGTQQISEAITTLDSKLSEFSAQYNTFDAGVDAAFAGSKEVANGAQKLLSGTQELNGGLNSLKSGAETLDKGAATLKNELEQSLLPGLATAAELQQKLNEEMKTAQQALENVPETDELQTVSGTVTQALQSAASDAGTTAQNAVLNTAANASASVKEQCKATLKAALDADATLTEEQKNAFLAALDGVGGYDASAEASTANGAVQTAVGTQGQAVQQALAPLSGMDTSALKETFGTVSVDAENLLSMMNEMTGKLYNPQDNTNTLYGGAVQIKGGTEQLVNGIGQIAGGASALAAGASQLDNGAVSLQSGLEKLSGSSKLIKDAIVQFKAGSSQLASGAGDLQQGMSTFRNKTDGVVNDLNAAQLDQISQIANALEEQANEYTSYTGSAEGVRCSVKFVMKVNGPDTTEEPSQKTSTSLTEQTTFWERIKNLFA